MRVTLSIILISVLQLLMLIATVNMAATMHNRYKARLSAADAIIVAIQAANLMILLQRLKGREIPIIATSANDKLLFVIQAIVIFLVLMRFAWLLSTVPKHHRSNLTPQSIREAIDYLPRGISFSTPSGKPVMTNDRMNRLVYQLTGHTIVNARAVWEELSKLGSGNDCVKLDRIQVSRELAGESEDGSMYFMLTDDSDLIPSNIQKNKLFPWIKSL